ncbi:MAG: hypothetical protein KGP06_01720 [Acidobacteria bacterium]|nr:hypothetical protein [Acidobacteriota bacterium]
MKSAGKSRITKAILFSTAVAFLASSNLNANAASKTITCYKGTSSKTVTGPAPKCQVGWSTTKPVAKPAVTTSAKPTTSATPATTAKAATNVLVFNGTYIGKISMIWSDSDVRVPAVTGAGTGTVLGLDELTGSGSATPMSQCESFDGAGTLSGGGNTLKVTFDSSAKACADQGAAPANVTITGNATVNGGTGKFAGATGTLKVTGSFSIKSTAAGTNESSTFKITLSGNINTK